MNTASVIICDSSHIHHHHNTSKNKNNATTSSSSISNTMSTTTTITTACGWRVKLYRLNVDGSWDDCGTGRICCQYSSPETDDISNYETTYSSNSNSNNIILSAVEQVYTKLNNPMLCMHAEVDDGSILLQTRILLQEKYQRQGDNIITWCEPSGQLLSEEQQQQSKVLPESTTGGAGTRVDLALSFQDNAGCLDIWNQIALVQQKASGFISQSYILQQQHQQQQQQQQQQRNDSTTDHNNSTTATNNNNNLSSTAPQHYNNNKLPFVKNSRINMPNAPSPYYESQHGMSAAAATEDSLFRTATPTLIITGAVQQERAVVLVDHQQPQYEDDIIATTVDTCTTNELLLSSSTQQHQGSTPDCSCLPDPPHAHNLEDIAEIIHAAMNNNTIQGNTSFLTSNTTHLQQFLLMQQQQQQQQLLSSETTTTTTTSPPSREDVCKALMDNDFLYFRKLLNLFPVLMQSPKNSNNNNAIISNLCTLASIIKLILFLNLEFLLEYAINVPDIYVMILRSLEYDPELRTLPAQHLSFLVQKLKFKTCVWIKDTTFEQAIHKCWRIIYLKDTVLRPTMVEEGTISTLANLLQRTHTDIVRFVGATTTTSSTSTNTPVTTTTTTTTPELEQITNNSTATPEHQQQHTSQNNNNRYEDCYLAQIMRMLGTELYSVVQHQQQQQQLQSSNAKSKIVFKKIQPSTKHDNIDDSTSTATTNDTSSGVLLLEQQQQQQSLTSSSIAMESLGNNNTTSSPWKQHLLPQDSSLTSRKLRRQGCLHFLRELFNMVRASLQHNAKCDFYVGICLMDVTIHVNNSNANETKVVNLLQLLGLILSSGVDSTVEEKSAALEVIFAIACFDSSLIRRHVLDETCQRPQRPSSSQDVVFPSSENDLLLSLCSIMVTEEDAGILLQTLELLRVVLDTDLHHPIIQQQQDGDNNTEYHHHLHEQQQQQQHDGILLYEEIHDDVDDEIVANAMGTAKQQHHHHKLHNNNNISKGSSVVDIVAAAADRSTISNDNNNSIGNLRIGDENNSSNNTAASLVSTNNPFLGIFYEHYIYWLAAPFQFSICIPAPPTQHNKNDGNIQTTTETAHHEDQDEEEDKCDKVKTMYYRVPNCAVRANFALEILCFCVRAHGYRMKNFTLRSRILSYVLKLLVQDYGQSGDECLKLAALRFLRTIISVKDEFYSRHIVQHDLFAPVFELFLNRGHNLVSSSIIEMCDFIKNENMKTLLEYIVTRYIYNTTSPTTWKRDDNTSSPNSQQQRLTAATANVSPTGDDSSSSDVNDGRKTTNSGHRTIVSLEGFSEQHDYTFKLMRQKHEENLSKSTVAVSSASCEILRLSDRDSQSSSCSDENEESGNVTAGGGKHAFPNGTMTSSYTISSHHPQGVTGEAIAALEYDYVETDNVINTASLGRGVLSSHKALEDQRKFREVDDEESYFNDDDDDNDDGEQQHGDCGNNNASPQLGEEEILLTEGRAQHFMGFSSSSPSPPCGALCTNSNLPRSDDTNSKAGKFRSTTFTSSSAAHSATSNRLANIDPLSSSSTAVAPSWMPVQYGSSSDDDDDLESSTYSSADADDTDSSTSSIITYASSTSDVAKEDPDDWRAAKRARVLYGNSSGGEDEDCNINNNGALNNGITGNLIASTSLYRSFSSSEIEGSLKPNHNCESSAEEVVESGKK